MAESQESHGPVLNAIHKRLRSLRKKMTRIHYMEGLVSQGKILNKEQEETLLSKAAVTGSIYELEKLIQPLTDAVKQEVDVLSADMEKKYLSMVEEVLKLLYAGFLFDPSSQTDCTSMMAIREYERNCCLAYDHVSDDDADILGVMDLDQIATLGRAVLSRPLDSKLSHRNALRQCLDHARLWINNSPQPFGSDPSVTYAGLRRKLNKIMDSEYFTKTPEMKAPNEFQPGSYQVQSPQGTVIPVNAPDQVEAPELQVPVNYDQKEEAEAVNTQGIGNVDVTSAGVDDVHQGGEGEKFSETHVETEKSEIEKGLEQIAGAANQQSRGGGRGGGRGRRGYSNGGRRGRGGNRGGGGGAYFNGRNQYYEQGDGYYPRNNYFRGRGGRGGGSNNNHNYQVGEGGYLVAN